MQNYPLKIPYKEVYFSVIAEDCVLYAHKTVFLLHTVLQSAMRWTTFIRSY